MKCVCGHEGKAVLWDSDETEFEYLGSIEKSRMKKPGKWQNVCSGIFKCPSCGTLREGVDDEN